MNIPCPGQVSIPRRYAKNWGLPMIDLALSPFQFLVGTLKTYPKLAGAAASFMFQFLVGTLKTRISALVPSTVHVSIPRRYAKN